MPANQFLPFATGAGANALTFTQYSTQGYLGQGFQNGVAQPYDINTVLRQTTTGVSGLAQFIANNQSADVLDDGVPVNFTNKLTAALKAFVAASAPAQTAYGATSEGGLKLDGNNNFLLAYDNLPVETSISANDKIAFYTEESEDGLTAGTPFAATLSAISTYILGQAPASTKYGTTADAGLALDGNNNFGLAPSNLPFSDSVGDTDRTYLARNGGGAFLATLADVASYVLAKAASAQFQGSFGTAGSGYAIFEAFNPPLILQWTLYGGSGHGPFNVPFPITFPNQVFAMFATDSANQNGSGSGCYSYGLDFSNTSQAQIFSSAGSGVAWHTRLFALGC